MGGACNMYGGMRRLYRVLVAKSEGTRPLGKPRHKWEDNIKMEFYEVGWGVGDMDWIDLAHGRNR